MTTFGLTPREVAFLRRLTPEWRIQKFLDDVDYDVAGTACRSPRRVLRERTVQCLDGALFAAAALRLQGHRPLIMDLETVRDDDHVEGLERLDVSRRSALVGERAERRIVKPRIRQDALAGEADEVRRVPDVYDARRGRVGERVFEPVGRRRREAAPVVESTAQRCVLQAARAESCGTDDRGAPPDAAPLGHCTTGSDVFVRFTAFAFSHCITSRLGSSRSTRTDAKVR